MTISATRKYLAGTALLLLAAPSSAMLFSFNPYSESVWRQLQDVHALTEGNGFTLRNYVIGSLPQGQTETWAVSFEQGQEIVVTAACDVDCSNVHLQIRDAAGAVVAADAEGENRPMVRFTPDADRDYVIEVDMQRCGFDPCYFGFMLLESGPVPPPTAPAAVKEPPEERAQAL